MELMTSKETADYLRLSEGSLRQLRYTRQGPPYMKFGRAVRYDKDQVHAWLRQQTVQQEGAVA